MVPPVNNVAEEIKEKLIQHHPPQISVVKIVQAEEPREHSPTFKEFTIKRREPLGSKAVKDDHFADMKPSKTDSDIKKTEGRTTTFQAPKSFRD